MMRLIFIFIFYQAIIAFGQTDSLINISVQDSVTPMEEIASDMDEMSPMEVYKGELYNEKGYIRYMSFFAGIDFGLVSLQNSNYPLKYPESFSLRLNIIEYKKQLIENKFGLFSGVSLGYQQIGFQEDFTFKHSENLTIIQKDSLDYIKNQLRSFSVSIPIMFEINSKNTFKNNVHIAFGVQENYRYANSTYNKHKTSEATIVRKNSENIYVNPFNLEACIRVGFQNLTFFASRSLNPLFSPSKFNAEIYPFVVGLCIIPVNLNPEDSDEFEF